MAHLNIAVDGPAGAGKSTGAKAVAKALGIVYLDTGAMYRALGLKALRRGIKPSDETGVCSFLDKTRMDITYEQGVQHIWLDGEDVSLAIREPAVSMAASDISKIHAVRLKLVDMQREIASRMDVIMDGRDIGSFVLPHADFKFYLDAKPEIRAQRRVKELLEKGQQADYETVLADIIRRDENDKTRDFAPLVVASDAEIVDTSDMTLDEMTATILCRVRR